ncbi:MAG: electron transporter RnfD [Flavobacterium sp.]|nr:electron transporter RnfD [Pedobacter sp.]
MKNIFYTIVLFFVSLNAVAQLYIKPNNSQLTYQGRVSSNADSTSIYWSGSTVSINFKGTILKAKLKSTKEDAYFYVIIDDSVTTKIEVLKNQPAQYYTLASGLGLINHSATLFKVSNCTSANQFYGFQINDEGKVLKARKLPKRKIEFYGNSITVGHGADRPASLADSGEPKYFNNYYTYAAITARYFNSQYVNTSRSGIGVTISWFPEIMPETYNRLDPLDSNSEWDFRKYQPDVIVVNLFQNDSWLINNPSHPQFENRFGTQKPSEAFIINAYKNLISNIRKNNLSSVIICALGNMDATKEGSKWPGYIREATNQLNDDKIFNVVFPYKNTEGHPRRIEQTAMAKQLISFIEANVKW